MRAFVKKLVGIIARFYHTLRATHLVWWHVLNRHGRALFNRDTKLSSLEERIVRDLKQGGIALVPVEELIPGSLAALQAFAQERWSDPEVREREARRADAMKEGKLTSKDYFLVNLWQGAKVLDLDNPFIRFSVNDAVLQIINAYLGTFSKFRGWHLQVTVPMNEGERRYASQEWHRDPEDLTLIKTFLYLNDVDEEAGPFTYLKGSQPGGKWQKLFPVHPPRGSSGKEEQLPKEDIISCTGKAGTLIFCDTTGLHRGGYARSKERMMYTSIYTTPASVWPILFSPGLTQRKGGSGLSERATFALDNNPQREPRFYKF